MTTDDTLPDNTQQKRDRLVRYLHRQTRDGELYCKSKFIADELDLSPKEIGYLMTCIDDTDPDLEIQQWGNARAITWRVSRQE